MIPAILITGFLGSGKTTFINWLLKNNPEKKISVILNEFGSISLESQFIKEHNEGIVEISSGCMCCIAKNDIPRVINYILENSPQTEMILIEASGLSDPEPIFDSFKDPIISEKVHLLKTICLVDALNFEKMFSHHSTMSAQISDADTILVSKLSTLNNLQRENLVNYLKNLLPHTQITPWTPMLKTEEVAKLDKLPTRHITTAPKNHQHENLKTWWFLSDMTLDLSHLQDSLRGLPKEIIRIKGVVKVRDAQKVLLQYVNGSLELVPDTWKESEKKQTALLFIGTDFVISNLEKKLHTCELV